MCAWLKIMESPCEALLVCGFVNASEIKQAMCGDSVANSNPQIQNF